MPVTPRRSFGKWGLGEATSPGHPNNQGFDVCYGYLNQHHAHNYYPTFLYRNKERLALRNVAEWENTERGEGWARERIDYTHDLIHAEAEAWLKENHKKPFFLYLSYTIPHANNEGTRGTGDGQDVPDYGIYADKDWSRPNKGQAAMITRMDRDIGRVLDQLKEHGIDKKEPWSSSPLTMAPTAKAETTLSSSTPTGPYKVSSAP